MMSLPAGSRSSIVCRRTRRGLGTFRSSGGRIAVTRFAGLLLVGFLPTVCAAQPPATSGDGSVDLALLAPLDPGSPLTYHIEPGTADSASRAGDDALCRRALEAWSDASGGLLRFVPSDEESALVRIYFVSPLFGQYGEMRPLDVDGRRGAAVFIRPDTRALGPRIAADAEADPLLRDAIVYLTCLHELGHALGLEHTDVFEDIMYFFGFGGDISEFFGRYRAVLGSRDDIAAVSGLSDGDIGQLRALYDIR